LLNSTGSGADVLYFTQSIVTPHSALQDLAR